MPEMLQLEKNFDKFIKNFIASCAEKGIKASYLIKNTKDVLDVINQKLSGIDAKSENLNNAVNSLELFKVAFDSEKNLEERLKEFINKEGFADAEFKTLKENLKKEFDKFMNEQIEQAKLSRDLEIIRKAMLTSERHKEVQDATTNQSTRITGKIAIAGNGAYFNLDPDKPGFIKRMFSERHAFASSGFQIDDQGNVEFDPRNRGQWARAMEMLRVQGYQSMEVTLKPELGKMFEDQKNEMAWMGVWGGKAFPKPIFIDLTLDDIKKIFDEDANGNITFKPGFEPQPLDRMKNAAIRYLNAPTAALNAFNPNYGKAKHTQEMLEYVHYLMEKATPPEDKGIDVKFEGEPASYRQKIKDESEAIKNYLFRAKQCIKRDSIETEISKLKKDEPGNYGLTKVKVEEKGNNTLGVDTDGKKTTTLKVDVKPDSTKKSTIELMGPKQKDKNKSEIVLEQPSSSPRSKL